MMRSYPSIYNVGHKLVAEMLDGPVYVEEKIDGSQFSFGVDKSGMLYCRSKGQEISVEHPEKLFEPAVETSKRLAHMLHPGWTYRCEYLRSPKHNTLAYARIPKQHLMVFDIDRGDSDYALYVEKHEEADRIGLECVPLVTSGGCFQENLTKYLDCDSVLGGQKVEGLVIKRQQGYEIFGPDKKPLIMKLVSPAFRERHTREWKQSHPAASDIIEKLTEIYRTEARWRKALQHLRDSGQLTGTMRDIPLLMKEAGQDTEKECADEIKDLLYRWAWPKVQRKLTHGLPEWYKGELGSV